MGDCQAKEMDFKFFLPLDVKKSDKPGKENEMRIGGIASDEDSPDLQGEKVFVEGLDTSYLLQRGAFNWDHGKGPGDILGEIDIADKVGKKFYVEGFLYPNVPAAVDTFNLMRSMKESGSKRKLGLSLEGKIKERDALDGKVIKKAWIKNVAVTYNPINQGTWIDMIKSLGNVVSYSPCTNDCSKCSLCEVEKSVSSEGVKETVKPAVGASQQAAVVSSEASTEVASLTKNQEVPDPVLDKSVEKVTPSEDLHITEKAMAAGYDIPATSGGVSGSAVRDESLEQKTKITTYQKKDILKKKRKKNGQITKSELIELLQEEHNYPIRSAELMADLIFKSVEITGYTRTRRGKFERVKPYTKELTHELFRMKTMSDNALMTRSRKITQPAKLVHFYNVAKMLGKQELAGYVKSQGHRLGLTNKDFEGVAEHVGAGLKSAARDLGTSISSRLGGKPAGFNPSEGAFRRA
jgi:hypothetical protein